MSDDLQRIGLLPSLFAVLHKPGGVDESSINEQWKLVAYDGSETLRNLVEQFLQVCALRYYSSWSSCNRILDGFRSQLPLITGSGILFIHFYNDLHARVSLIKRNGVEEYLYWQPILQRNRAEFLQLRQSFTSDILRQKPDAGLILQSGILFCTIPRESVLAAHLNTLKSILEYEAVEYAIIEEGKPGFFSAGFPQHFRDAGFANELKPAGQWYGVSCLVRRNEKNIRIHLARKIMPLLGTKELFISLLMLFFTVCLLRIWYLTVFRERKIARRFAWQLWSGLIAAAVVPLSVVYTLNEWYALEQTAQEISQQRVGIIRHFEELERRQFFQEIAEWDMLQRISHAPELENAIKMADAGGPSAKENLGEVVSRLARKKHDVFGEARFTELLIFHAHGWQHAVYPDSSKKSEAGDFKRFIAAFQSPLFADLGVTSRAGSENANPGVAAKAEITRDAGLEIFRTLFGVDTYFRLVHGLDLPIKAFMSTGLGCFRLIPVPGMLKPEVVLFWLFFDSLNTSMREVFQTSVCRYPVYAEAKAMYGALKQPWTGGWDPGIVSFARWAMAKKSPLSSRGYFAGRECLVEARIGSHNEVMVMIGLIPEEDITGRINDSRRGFHRLLLLALLSIVFLSMGISGDLTSPIHELTRGVKKIAGQDYSFRIPVSRNDELGRMLQSFNSMARGLEEKELMGQMVSGAARRMVSDRESLLLAEKGQRLHVTVLYLAVPEFAGFVRGSGNSELIKDLGRHIDQLCRIIMENSGEVDKIIGEKIHAYYFVSGETGIANAAAIRTIQMIRAAERAGNLFFPVSAGIYCGEVIAGLLGVGSKRDFTIIGDPVNTAARICSRAAGLPCERFLVSEDVIGTLRENEVVFRPFGEVQLKGKNVTVNLFQCLFR